ncbi:type VI secretion system tube protein TssD [Saccharicrinis aurantiacus]|uniref:type VI secretion system tube protein TssD n=1 Tax=Saccharicrinis aurantiacus TaxID=1849719 RepID=UPI00094FD39E|nr:type VI secretion system tube protein TssD [Saccharicrinis aurantiacus]
MYQIKLVVDSYERWLTGLHYEYFCPIEVDKAYYRKFLQKNFPYEMGDAYNLHPYANKLPLVKWSQLDERLQQDCMRQAQSDFYQTTPKFNDLCLGEFGESDTKKVGYYNTLAMARHKAGLDYGIVPNYTHNYDKYLSPVQNITARTTYNKIGGLFSLELNSSENDDYLYEWLLTSQMRQGKLVFYDGDGDQAFKIEFWDCFCIGVQENMSAEGNTAMKMNVRLSPAITRNRSAEHQKVWKVTDITPTNRAFGPSSVSEEPDEEKQKDKLLVKKVEGPFFENGQVAEEMIEGNTYIYKATEYTQAEGDKLALTQWAEQLSDDGQITNIRGAKSYLDNDGVICFKYKAKKAEKIRIYAYVESAAERVSVLTNTIVKETIIIVGTEQHSANSANKLMFPAQAVREVRENLSEYPYLKILIFKDGYTKNQLEAFSKVILSYNEKAKVLQINSIEELINFINGGSIKMNKESKYRDSKKISDIKIFAHGYVRDKTNEGVIAFGLDGKNASKQELDYKTFSEIKENVFLKNNQSHLYSYACRTGIGVSSEIVTNPLKSNSLAQKISNHSQIIVHAYMKRSLYEDTWGTQNHRDTYISDNDKGESFFENLKTDIKDVFADDPKDMNLFTTYISTEKKIDGAIWNSKGAYLPVKAGDFPKGISSNYETYKPQ